MVFLRRDRQGDPVRRLCEAETGHLRCRHRPRARRRDSHRRSSPVYPHYTRCRAALSRLHEHHRSHSRFLGDGPRLHPLWPCPSWLLRRQSPRVPLRASRCSFSLSSRPDLLPPLFRRPTLRHPASPLSLAPERLLAAESLLRRHPPLPLRSPLRRFPHPLLARRRRFALVPLLTQRPRSSRSTVFKTSSSPLCRVSLPPRVAGSSRAADCRDRPPSWSSAACGFSQATSLRNRWSAR